MKKKCLHPFTSININPRGSISPCCAYPTAYENIANIENLTDFFENNKKFIEIRDIENRGEWQLPECISCSQGEEAGVITRKSMVEQWFNVVKPEIIPNGKIRFIDMSFSNTCNLTCVMCDSKFSSSWYKPMSSFNKSWAPVHIPHSIDYKDVDKILNILDTVDLLEIKGGEPLYDKRFIYFLEKIAGRDVSTDIQLTTNFTVINERYCEYLNNIKKLTLNISIDGTHKMYEWIRGFEFSKIENNLLTFLPKLNTNSIIINFTSTVYNIINIKKFCNWIDNVSVQTGKKLTVSFNLIAKYPMHVSPLLSDNIPRVIEDLNYIKTQKYNVLFINQGRTIDNLIDFLSQERVADEQLINRHKEWHKFMVSMRGFDIND